ncbi:zinc finger and BTB domain-containing protein 1 [Bufo gargarizans]|uniref:zinc finger and BTB domain-containing protein 1 n=1 Tax=Bufo gargarizans TaxID=30331 RepID=UPI001CF21485|nr:zinc finger and BTB domain-containing protein 1 [Bufo gargarizans]
MMGKASHCSYVLQQLYNQREWGFLCDCCISISDIYFQAHKAVLAACSSYFKMMFINHQHTMAQINLTNTKISAECFDLILQFMYLGKILKAPENFEQLKHAMSYLQLYVIPDCLEDIQDIDSSIKCSSSASSSLSSKMVFGVRMYEEPKAKSREEPSKRPTEPELPVNTVPEKQVEQSVPPVLRKQLQNVCKKTPSLKVSNPRERGSRRFGRSYTCESCGFAFSCEKLLDEHSQTCTNRHFFQNRDHSSNDPSQSGSESPASKFSPSQDNAHRADSSQYAEASVSSQGAKNSSVILDQIKNEPIDTTEKNTVIIKIEADENSMVEMEDINIVKISDKDYFESSDIDDEEEADESLGGYYIGEHNEKALHQALGSCRKDVDSLDQDGAETSDPGASDMACELCGMTVTEQDLSSHYLSQHIENICACGKCGQILVKGRQLQEHAQRCGEAQERLENSERSIDERMHFGDSMEETSGMGELADMWEDFSEGGICANRQIYKHSSCPYRCPNCGQRFGAENLVVEHMSQCLDHEVFRSSLSDDNEKDHRRKHFCDICGKGFFQRCHLREHYTVHTKEKQFSCQICGKQFLRERQLRLHNDMHTGMARYVCSLCDQGNFRKHDHVRHMISHLAAGETICQVCFQIFPSNELLEQHMDIHLYTCGVCGAKFNLRKDMRAHYNSKHFKKA